MHQKWIKKTTEFAQFFMVFFYHLEQISVNL